MSVERPIPSLPGEAEQRSLPTVEYSSSLNNPRVPYAVNFDAELYAQVLREMGFPDNQIASTKVKISRKSLLDIPFVRSLAARTEPFSKNITIYCDPIWKLRTAALSAAERLANNEGKWLDEYRFEVLRTKKLPDYLKKAPQERSLPFARKLIENGAQRFQTGVVLHETQHKADLSLDMRKKNVALLVADGVSPVVLYPAAFIALNSVGVDYVISGIGSVIGALLVSEVVSRAIPGSLHHLERSARQFERNYNSEPRYRGILMITPKEEMSMVK